MSRCLIALCLFVAAHSASVKKRNIPVEVLYERSSQGNRNLEERVQISHNDLLRFKLSDDIINEGQEEEATSKIQSYGVRNLDAKVQLSPEELQQAVKHLPNVVDDEEIVKAELQNAQTTQPSAPDTHTLDMLKKVEEIVYTGICTIKNNVDSLTEAAKPSEAEWEKLNQTLQNFFEEQHRKISLKQDQPTDNNQNNQNNQFFQNFISGFQNITNNFIQTYFPQNQQNNGTEDEQSGQGGNPWQTFINMFQGGINNIVNNFNNQNSNSTGQEDTGSEQNQSNNFFGNVVSSIQEFFSNQSPSSNNQSDTGTSNNNQGPTQIFQSIGNQIGNFFNPTTKPPNSEDEGAASTTQSNFINNIGQAFQNFNLFGQSTTPASQGGGANPISQVGSQFQQLVGGQGGNPIAQGIQNAIGGGSTTEKSKGDGEKSQEVAASEKVPEEGSATPASEKIAEEDGGSSTVSAPQKGGTTEDEMVAQKNEEIGTSSAPEVKNTEEMAEAGQKVE